MNQQTHGAPIMATHDEAAAKKPQTRKPSVRVLA